MFENYELEKDTEFLAACKTWYLMSDKTKNCENCGTEIRNSAYSCGGRKKTFGKTRYCKNCAKIINNRRRKKEI